MLRLLLYVVPKAGIANAIMFTSVVDAVKCVVEIQRDLAVRNAALPYNRKTMEFRIGVNLGDVIEEEGRIYGDGVNIAARFEGLASAGGIVISGIVYDSIKDKLSLRYQKLVRPPILLKADCLSAAAVVRV